MQDTVEIYAHYGIKGIPHYVIVSPEGRIIHVWSGYGTGVLKKKLEDWVK
ncbi:TlpA family protein disulfide reductase [Paraprevotella clara]